MTDMGKPIYRTFDPSKETGAEPPEKHRRSLRDRIMRGGDAAAPAPAPSPSGYVHQPPERTESQPSETQADDRPQPVQPAPPSATADEPAAPAQEQPPRDSTAADEAAGAPSRAASPSPAPTTSENADQPIGVVLEISGAGSQVAIDLARLNECAADADPAIAMAGQVGSQIKIRVGNSWLLASVRNQKQDRKAGSILANIDFLGEGA